MTRADVLLKFLTQMPFPFEFACDPEMHWYRAFTLGRTSWWSFFRPSTIAQYLGWMARGFSVHRINPDEDALQLGGDFVIDPEGKIVFAYPSRDATDRPAVSDLIAHL